MTTRDAETTQTGLRVELFVADPARSAEFYVDALGFEVIRRSAGDYVSVGREGAVLGLNAVVRLPGAHPIKPRDAERRGLGVEIVVMVGDVEAAHRRAVQRRPSGVSPLVRQPWGLTDFRVLDPDGYYIRLTSLSEAGKDA